MQATITTQTLANTSGLTPGSYRVQVARDGTTFHTNTNSAPGPFNFTASTPGSYVATVQRLSDGGENMGPSVASPPLVLSGPATFEAPLTVTLTL
jgi:Flp pilus assembly protein TadG